ncbi:MAG: hypothetical protein KF734_16030 [Saprospiraceae bacterium]|nr:hypothetical protein [Saprospiraceae bacterium]
MKKNLLTSFLLLANVTLAGVYIYSCQHEADALAPKPLSDTPVTERACLNNDYCSYVITATADCSVVLCGDIVVYTGTCNNGCNSLGQDFSISVSLTANVPHTFCVRDIGSVCIHNPSTATQAINVSVQVAGTTPINVAIPIGESRCFHSNDDCDETFSGCI